MFVLLYKSGHGQKIYNSPQSFEVNLKTALFFFLLLLKTCFENQRILFFLSLEGFYMFPIVVLSGWAWLGMVGRAWAHLGALGSPWEGFYVLICYMFLFLVSSYI